MKIKDIVSTPLYSSSMDKDMSDSAQDSIVVEVVTDEPGMVGVGETDAPPAVVKSFIEMRSSHDTSVGLKDILVGEDPLQIERLWNRMYERTKMAGRRGIGVNAIGAIDMALWDLAGKYYNKPVWALLGGAQKEAVSPYGSLFPLMKRNDPEREKVARYVRTAKDLGFRAVKLEELMNSPRRDLEIVGAAREALGEDGVLMVDAYYCWPDYKTALAECRKYRDMNLYFIETPLPVDDVEGYANLRRKLGIRVAMGEFLTSRYEFIDLIDRGGVDVAQPDIGRVGGFTEARKVADYAAAKGVLVVPHCWKTGIGIAASLHYCVATSNCPYFEFMVKELSPSELRRSLVRSEPRIKDGLIEAPLEPGLGIEIDRAVMERFSKPPQ